MSASVPTLLAALLLEAAAFSPVSSLDGTPLPAPARLALHLLASGLVAWAFTRRSAASRPSRTAGLGLLAGLASLFMPFIAPLGLLLALGDVPGRRPPGPRAPSQGPVREAVAATGPQPVPQPRLARDLWGVLRHAGEPHMRIAALEATLDLDDASAVPMLRFALQDAEDEVRLLAFALVTERERACTQPVTSTPGQQAFAAERQSAYAQWRLAQLAGVGGPAAQPLCRRALQHARAALAHRQQDGALHLLAARLHLELGEGPEAAQAIDSAQQSGFAHERCARLRMELALRSRERRTGRPG